MFPLHPSVQAGNRMRSAVALNFGLVLTPALHCTIRYVVARTQFTLARRAVDEKTGAALKDYLHVASCSPATTTTN